MHHVSYYSVAFRIGQLTSYLKTKEEPSKKQQEDAAQRWIDLIEIQSDLIIENWLKQVDVIGQTEDGSFNIQPCLPSIQKTGLDFFQ